MANLVAKRCSVLERAEDRELIWFTQLISHQPGGIKKLAADLMAQFLDLARRINLSRLHAEFTHGFRRDSVRK
ncbi:MAG: hypothetical protein ACLPRE_11350, partial [Limisphaerales bacterium]